MNRGLLVALDSATFRKSSHSNPNQDCVEIGRAAAALGVRDSKLSHSPTLAVDAELGQAFVDAVKTGRFDL